MRVILALVTVLMLVAAAGFAALRTDGFGEVRAQLGMADVTQFEWPYMSNEACLSLIKSEIKPDFCMLLGNPDNITIAVLGDSTANALVPGIADLATQHSQGIINVGSGSCPPNRGMVPPDIMGLRPNCHKPVDAAYRFILGNSKIKTVIMGIFVHDIKDWEFYDLPQNASLEDRFNRYKEAFNADILALRAAGKRVIVTYDAVLSPVSSRDCLNRPLSQGLRASNKCDVTRDQIIDLYPYQPMFDEFFRKREDLCVFRQTPVLFTNDHLNLFDTNGLALLRDSHHLSVYGAKKMAQRLAVSNCKGSLP